MYRLVCNAQKYDWGRRGHQSKVALYKRAQDSEFTINDNESYAELWMGWLRFKLIFIQKII
jgi:mannose-6-phosphate isomerase class I